LEQLDPSFHASSGVSEAPVQMKANGGTLVVDDFGRQRVSPTELLNRLIVPLEKRFDFLSLATGRQAQVPFELLFVLSTNLEPRELIDEAFLRRIPYKVEVTDPTLGQFHELFASVAASLGLQMAPGVVDELLAEHYAPHSRPLRFCHPRDLLRQARNHCVVHERPPVADRESLGAAVRNYFAGL
ncbi:MAG: AAA family ATPase, partial [Planctomycetota bacterium]